MNILKEVNAYRERYGANLLRAAITGLDNGLVYLYGKTPSRGPLIIGWDLTYVCQARCSFCDFWSKGIKSKNELPMERVKQTIRDAGKAGVWMISFTGGEPLIVKELPELIRECKKNGINVNINTNGGFLEKRAEELIDAGVDSITVSSDSHLAEVHNSIRRTPMLFEKLHAGILKVRELREKKGSKRPYLMVRCALSKRNYKQFGDYIEFFEKIVDEVSAQPLYEGTEGSMFHIKDANMRLANTDQGEFEEYMATLRKKHPFLRNTYYKEFGNFIFNQEKLKKRYKCFSSFFYLVFDPHGGGQSCAMFVKRFGGLRENSLMEIWKSDQANDFRKVLKNKEYKCFCWSTDWITSVYLSKVLR